MPFRPLHTASLGYRILLSTIVCMAGRGRGGGENEKGKILLLRFGVTTNAFGIGTSQTQQRLTAMNWRGLRFDTIAGREEEEGKMLSSLLYEVVLSYLRT